jgi:branched-chain amino acid transport system ATP-binding protein
MNSALLSVKNLCAGYGSSQVLFDVDFEVNAGEVITLLGRNGMGKSTTVKCLAGLLTPTKGSIRFAGHEVAGAAAYVVGRLGFGLVPEGRQVFPTLTVFENLVATANTRNVNKTSSAGSGSNLWDLDRVHQMFPILAQRAKQQAGMLSGGEQQMLAIGRALMTNPRLLVLDEATEGLAPLIREDIWRCLSLLKEQGQAMIVIDKNLKPLLHLAQRHYVFEKGRVVFVAQQGELADPEAILQKYLHV